MRIRDPYYSKEYSVRIDFDKKTGEVVGEFWVNQDEKSDRYGNLPSVIHFDPISGKKTYISYCVDGEEHREGGPARIIIDPDSDTETCHVWASCGAIHRDGDEPAIILRNPRTGKVIRLEYLKNNLPHRETGPAVIEFDPETEKIIYQQYWLDGHQLEDPSLSTPRLP